MVNIPDWKWEGYAEYVSRQGIEQKDLVKNRDRLAASDERATNSWEIMFPDQTVSPRAYYNYWMLVQYCMDIKKMNYKELPADKTDGKVIRQEMMNWYKQ